MGISTRDHKKLWGRAGNRCSMSECRRELVDAQETTDEDSIIGEECHIVARKQSGPRGKSKLLKAERDYYSNLILMCRNHHKIIDDMVSMYSVTKLKQIKQEHEEWVRHSLDEHDETKQSDDEFYAEIADTWREKANLCDWVSWSSNMLSGGRPNIILTVYNDLQALREWLLRRVWPGRYPTLEAAFTNYRIVLADLLNEADSQE